MRLLTGSIFAFIIAALVGLGATWLTVSSGIAFGSITLGSWTAYPRIGTSGADPYARATIARTGQLVVGLGDGVAFSAYYDDDGKPLDGRCEVILTGVTPPARFWTLTLYNPEGKLIANSVNRYGFTSQEVMRRADGSFEITIAPRADFGNWLPTGGAERYMLILRLYDTAVGVSTRAGREAPMPAIKTTQCPT